MSVEAFLRQNKDADVLIVIARTGSGKTTGTLKFLSSSRAKGIFLVPTKALAAEVFDSAVRLMKGKRVVRDDSDTQAEITITPADWAAADFIVSTYERAYSVLSSPAVAKALFARPTYVVIDEFHNIIEPERAFAIEAVTALTAFYGGKLILLSATFPEKDEIVAKFKALGKRVAVYEASHGSHVDVELVAVNTFCDDGSTYCRGCTITRRGLMDKYYRRIFRRAYKQRDPYSCYEPTDELVIDVILKQPKPILLFVPNRRFAEEFAKVISEEKGLSAVPYHSGLLRPIRTAVQRYFQALASKDFGTALAMLKVIKSKFPWVKDKIDVIVATHALSQGVNLPVETVAIPYLHRVIGSREVSKESVITLTQMAGRAGRFSGKGKVVMVYDPYINKVEVEDAWIRFGDEEALVTRVVNREYEKAAAPSWFYSLALELLALTVFGSMKELRRWWYPDDVRLDRMLEDTATERRSIVAAVPLVENGRPTDIAKVFVRMDIYSVYLTFWALETRAPPEATVFGLVVSNSAVINELKRELRNYVDGLASGTKIDLPKVRVAVPTESVVGVFGDPYGVVLDNPLAYADPNVLGKVVAKAYVDGQIPSGALSATLKILNAAKAVVKWAERELAKGRRVENRRLLCLEDENCRKELVKKLDEASCLANSLFRAKGRDERLALLGAL